MPQAAIVWHPVKRGLLNHPPPILEAPLSELGVLLRNARQKQQITVDQVSTATRIKPVFLEALEEGDYHLLPGPAYIIGFLRNYAQFLGLQPDEIVQEYYAEQPPPQPAVKAATRVLASGYERQLRARFFWAFGGLVLLLAGGFAVKEYDATYARTASTPAVTPANLGVTTIGKPVHAVPPAREVTLRLRPLAPIWARVTVDGVQKFQGLFRGRARVWHAHHSIYVVTLDGAHLRATYDGRPMGKIALQPGLTVWAATTTGWRKVS